MIYEKHAVAKMWSPDLKSKHDHRVNADHTMGVGQEESTGTVDVAQEKLTNTTETVTCTRH